jgi:uncharacterized protein YcgI (DUF1989 family)
MPMDASRLVNPASVRHRDLDARLSDSGTAQTPAPGWTRIPAQNGTSIRLSPGDRVMLQDPCGEQVSDVYLVSADDVSEQFSAGRTIDYGNSLYVSLGSDLYSNRSRVLAMITADSVGVHDLVLTPCSQDTFDLLYPEHNGESHPSCWANLVQALSGFGVDPDSIGSTLNVFMDVWTDARGELHIDPPPSGPGDYLEITAATDLLVGITACSAEKSNNGLCTPIDYRIVRAGADSGTIPATGVA